MDLMAGRKPGPLLFTLGLLLGSPVLVLAAEDSATTSETPGSERSADDAVVADDPSDEKVAPQPAETTPTEPPSDDLGTPPRKTKAGTGFFMRATLGGGHAWAFAPATEHQPGVAMQTLGGNLMLSPGYQLTPQFALHADLYSSMLFAHKTDTESEDYSAKGLGMVCLLYTSPSPRD